MILTCCDQVSQLPQRFPYCLLETSRYSGDRSVFHTQLSEFAFVGYVISRMLLNLSESRFPRL